LRLFLDFMTPSFEPSKSKRIAQPLIAISNPGGSEPLLYGVGLCEEHSCGFDSPRSLSLWL